MTRRGFLEAAAAFGMLPGAFANAGERIIRFGVISDVHLDCSTIRTESFRRVLEGFRTAQVDAVLIPGDIAHLGEIVQARLARVIWDEVFPGSKLPDGTPVVRLFLPGNHDWNFPKGAPHGKYIAENFKKNWEAALDEPFEPIRKVVVKGIPFVLVDWFAVKDVENWFGQHANEFDPSRPLIYAQHPHPAGTCYDSSLAYWNGDNGASTRALARFPKAIAFSGHSHFPVTDAYSIWQGAFTSVNCGSTYCSGRDYIPTDETKNGLAYDYKRIPELMPRVPVCDDCAPGLVVTISGDNVRIERRDYLRDLSLGPDWVFPLAGARPYALETRTDNRKAPQFASDARLCVSRVCNRFALKILPDDKVPGDQSIDVDQVRVAFPPAQGTDESRVFGYEVTCREEGSLRFVRFVLARGFHLPSSVPPISQAFYADASEFRTGARLAFEVRPMARFGAKGRPLVASMSF